MKKIKKIIAVAMAALIINIATLSPVLDVKASDVPAEASAVAIPLLQALYEILGITYGLGVSYEGMAGVDDSYVQDMIDRWNAGESLTVGTTEVPDLRNYDNLMDYFRATMAVYDAHIDGTAVIPYLIALDAKSYAATGTLYSRTQQLVLKMAAEQLTEEIARRGWQVLDGGLSNSGGSDDDDPMDFKATSMLLNALLAGQAVNGGDSTEEWVQAMESVYSFDELNMYSFEYNGDIYPVYFLSKVNWVGSDGYSYSIDLGSGAYAIFSLASNNYLTLYLLNRQPITSIYRKYDNGILIQTMDYSSDWRPSWSNGYYYNTLGLGIDSFYSYQVTDKADNIGQVLVSFLNSGLNINYVDNAVGISPTSSNGLSALDNKAVSVKDIIDLADQLSTQADATSGTDSALDDISAVIATFTEGLGDLNQSIEDNNELLNAILSVLRGIWTDVISLPDSIGLELPESITLELPDLVQDIADDVAALADSATDRYPPDGTDPTQPNNGHSADYTILLSSLFLLILILIKLLMIFFHCMQFIIAIFAIPAGTAFLPEEMIMGLDYTKSLTIPGIGMSVYGFMIGLVYICIVFYVIRTLRMNIDKIKMPGRK